MNTSSKVVIVTGAAAGIGRGIAEQFAKSGYIIIIADCDSSAGKRVAQELSEAGITCAFIETDVSDSASVHAMVEEVIERFGTVDVLVNNAGIVFFKALTEVDEIDWDKMLSVDLKGAFLCTKEVIPHMRRHHGGVIINISSNHAMATLPNSEAYAAAKSGILAFTKSLALSYGTEGIRAVAICPGFTETPHYRRWLSGEPDPAGLESEIVRLHPLGRIVSPSDVGKLATFLASDDAEMITGTEVVIDGGVSSQLYNETLMASLSPAK